jgi:hypothetical protein
LKSILRVMPRGLSQKKKKFLKKKIIINFTPKFCYFYSFGPPIFFFSI